VSRTKDQVAKRRAIGWQSSCKDFPYVVYLTDRRNLGGSIKLLPHPSLKSRSTFLPHRAAFFRTEAAAQRHLRGIDLLPHFAYIIGRW
jgi:hypothetical protein